MVKISGGILYVEFAKTIKGINTHNVKISILKRTHNGMLFKHLFNFKRYSDRLISRFFLIMYLFSTLLLDISLKL